ncbi:App1 family protein [Bifidobacterium psychraerophilum]|uniref:Phosphatidate phosphatase APP1 catalytic domain-containing protein n=1 Tax=Bifidobacterium psychraerophilum TaxID=218140 RepID=A0A087CNN3_9BIFI|nr:phosphatase domain-containing protein [Bifidobacterium psychraerophilum]KFI84883.1 hypothetical protein BPSY_0068 [Bifidobacterium psychraerophilum]PKA93987.1 phosphatidate phosphatase APP1 [Bifidobacterium psychraerophilum DSM 22366]
MDQRNKTTIRARRATTSFDTASPRERIEGKPLLIRTARRGVTGAFNFWIFVSKLITHRLRWYPIVEPYVGYGTPDYSRLICRTTLSPERGRSGLAVRGIRSAFKVPASRTQVKISIDGTRLRTVQVGSSEVYDQPDRGREQSDEFALSDSSGYLDLVAEHHLSPGQHEVSYQVSRRAPVTAPLYIYPSSTPLGVISDIDDTILVTQVPSLWRAAYNMLLLNPKKRVSVPGMSVLYNKIRDLYPHAPFFYLSTSPWNVESSIRHFINYHGFPEGPLLLRDLDPRPKDFIPTGVEHKLEFVDQLMADFPNMKFLLLGDDGQKDPTTYATVARRYPGRIMAIGIRQLSPRESIGAVAGITATQPMPVTDVPVFYGTTGSNLMNTMLPFLAASQGSRHR